VPTFVHPTVDEIAYVSEVNEEITTII